MHILAQLFLVLYGITEGPLIIAGISFFGLTLLFWAAVNHVLFHMAIRKGTVRTRMFWSNAMWWTLFVLAFYLVGFAPLDCHFSSLKPKNLSPDDSAVAIAIIFNAPNLIYWIASMAAILFIKGGLEESKVKQPTPKGFSIFLATVVLACGSYAMSLASQTKSNNELNVITNDFTDFYHRKPTDKEKADFEKSLSQTLGGQGTVGKVSFIGNFPGGVYGVVDIKSFKGSQRNSGTWYWTKFTPNKDSLWTGVRLIEGKYYASTGADKDTVDRVLADCEELKNYKNWRQ